jgi:pimeloyl-[acyl-carrier protein] methyl ester esterase
MTTLVLLPGLDGTGDLFDPLVHELEGTLSITVVRYPQDPKLGYRELLQFAREALPATGPVVLLGESFSGPIAIQLAAERPSQVRGLILCCTFASNPRPEFGWLSFALPAVPFELMPVSSMLQVVLGMRPAAEIYKLAKRVFRALPPAVIRARLRQIASVNVMDELRRIAVPVLYLQATGDLLVPHAAGAKICANCSSAELVQIPGPHGLLQTKSNPAAGVVRAFMQRIQNGL